MLSVPKVKRIAALTIGVWFRGGVQGKQLKVNKMSPEAPQNRVAAMFDNRTVFITGGSGFLGKVLIEKLLRDTNVKQIYLLLRTKKGKSPNERLNDIFDNMLYDVLKQKRPEALKKCKVIPGDVTEVDLGMSQQDRKLLQDQVDFIYHSAASTRFDDSLRKACIMNTRGTKYVIDLAYQCNKLQCLVHVSTAYAYPEEKVLYEKIYKPPGDPHQVLNALDWINDDDTQKITKHLLGNCPNTYTFSKACAESLIAEEFGKLPVIIVRPSVVCPTMREPIPGWCNNLQGPMGLLVGAGKGIIRSMYVQGHSYADFVPADYAINAFILATWYYLNADKNQHVFNVTASSEYNFTWEEIIEHGKYVIYNIIPFNGVVWYPGGSMKKTRWVHNVHFYLAQLIPAIFIDMLLVIFGYKPILYQIQRRIQSGGEVFEYYTTKSWNFSNATKDKVQRILHKVEKEVFEIEPEQLDLRGYFTDCMKTVRRNNLKETDDTIPAAWRHMKIMWTVDKIAKIAFFALIVYYVYKFFCNY